VIGVSAAVNLVVSVIVGRTARRESSAALRADAAHLGADAVSSAAVLVGLTLVAVTHAQWIDPAVALAVAAWIAVAGVRILRRAARELVDEALPEAELAEIRAVIRELGSERGVVGFHKLRARSAGARRYVDVHIQFGAGTTLEDAHKVAHELTNRIGAQLPGSDVLVHVEPEDRVEPGTEL
jgi:cation diffusion facilitator family transporter